jgi:titin
VNTRNTTGRNVSRRSIRSAVNSVLERLEGRQLMAAFTVSNTLDAGPGSLRDAMTQANLTPGADAVLFAIPGPGPHTIQPLSPLPDVTDPVFINGASQPGYAGSPLVELDGALAGAGASGLHILAGGSNVRGLAINQFNNGIVLDRAGKNVVQRNYIGTDVTGTAAKPNRIGILVVHSPDNLIGGSLKGEFNVISGNSDGVQITGSMSSANRVQGNFIGTDVTGTRAVGNRLVGVRVLRNANGNLVGGISSDWRNIISANLTGVAIAAGRTLVQGNFIGTDITGRRPLGNGTGVFIDGTATVGVAGNLVGGARGGGNVISANGRGVTITGRYAVKNLVQGNRIGTDVTGTAALGNATYGVAITGSAYGNLVGGASSAVRNVISANREDGVDLTNGATRNQVLGNFIGTDVSGLKPLGNGSCNVRILFANYNRIGSAAPGAGNVIAASTTGIAMAAASTVVEGNFIGTDATGNAPMGNNTGVFIDGNATSGVVDNHIGGAAAGAGNVISANAYGLSIYGQYAQKNFVQGNSIGVAAGGGALGNAVFGVQVAVNASDNWVGGLAAGEGNHVAYNGAEGVVVVSGSRNPILSNSIHDNGKLGIDLNADGVSANDFLDADGGANETQNYPELGSAVSFGGSTTVNGKLHSTPGRDFIIQLFSNVAPDPSGFGEGQTLVWTGTVTTNAAGDATFSALFAPALPGGMFVSSTATDRLTLDTSEFSRVIGVREIPTIDPIPVPLPIPLPFPRPIDPVIFSVQPIATGATSVLSPTGEGVLG